MKNPMSANVKSHGRFLSVVSAVCLLGFSGCSSFDARAAKEPHATLIGNVHPQAGEDEDVVASEREWHQLIH
jgi:hypothetical protein